MLTQTTRTQKTMRQDRSAGFRAIARKVTGRRLDSAVSP